MDAPIYTGGHARRSLVDTVTFRLLSQITTPLALIIQVRGMTEHDFGVYSLLSQGGDLRERLEIVTVDSLALPRLDFLKVDVEGMEIDVIKGAQASIAKGRPWLWVEHWIIGADKVKAAVTQPDYRFLLVDGMNMLCAPSEKLAASGIVFQLPEV